MNGDTLNGDTMNGDTKRKIANEKKFRHPLKDLKPRKERERGTEHGKGDIRLWQRVGCTSQTEVVKKLAIALLPNTLFVLAKWYSALDKVEPASPHSHYELGGWMRCTKSRYVTPCQVRELWTSG